MHAELSTLQTPSGFLVGAGDDAPQPGSPKERARMKYSVPAARLMSTPDVWEGVEKRRLSSSFAQPAGGVEDIENSPAAAPSPPARHRNRSVVRLADPPCETPPLPAAAGVGTRPATAALLTMCALQFASCIFLPFIKLTVDASPSEGAAAPPPDAPYPVGTELHCSGFVCYPGGSGLLTHVPNAAVGAACVIAAVSSVVGLVGVLLRIGMFLGQKGKSLGVMWLVFAAACSLISGVAAVFASVADERAGGSAGSVVLWYPFIVLAPLSCSVLMNRGGKNAVPSFSYELGAVGDENGTTQVLSGSAAMLRNVSTGSQANIHHLQSTTHGGGAMNLTPHTPPKPSGGAGGQHQNAAAQSHITSLVSTLRTAQPPLPRPNASKVLPPSVSHQHQAKQAGPPPLPKNQAKSESGGHPSTTTGDETLNPFEGGSRSSSVIYSETHTDDGLLLNGTHTTLHKTIFTPSEKQSDRSDGSSKTESGGGGGGGGGGIPRHSSQYGSPYRKAIATPPGSPLGDNSSPRGHVSKQPFLKRSESMPLGLGGDSKEVKEARAIARVPSMKRRASKRPSTVRFKAESIANGGPQSPCSTASQSPRQKRSMSLQDLADTDGDNDIDANPVDEMEELQAASETDTHSQSGRSQDPRSPEHGLCIGDSLEGPVFINGIGDSEGVPVNRVQSLVSPKTVTIVGGPTAFPSSKDLSLGPLAIETNSFEPDISPEGVMFLTTPNAKYEICKPLSANPLKQKIIRDVATDGKFALKVYNKSIQTCMNAHRFRFSGPAGAASAMARIRQEVAILKRLRHKHLIELLEVVDDPEHDRLALVVELAAKPTGDVDPQTGLLTTRTLSENFIRHYFVGIVSALRYLHKCKIAQTDIRPENVLLFSDGTAKLSGFGVTHLFSCIAGDSVPRIDCSSPAYFPPEACSGSQLAYRGPPADVWALGVTILTLHTGRHPFHNHDQKALRLAVMTDHPPIPSGSSPSFRELVAVLINKDPRWRPSLREVYYHSFFKVEPAPSPMLGPNTLASDVPKPKNNYKPGSSNEATRNLYLTDVSEVESRRLSSISEKSAVGNSASYLRDVSRDLSISKRQRETGSSASTENGSSDLAEDTQDVVLKVPQANPGESDILPSADGNPFVDESSECNEEPDPPSFTDYDVDEAISTRQPALSPRND
ncbi:Serine/threonine-protein kinase GRIK2 [Diplonema papillatum]|nr:Serine/threonine-protein kinase GRIK2 [Diplonema papillatum]